jgi:hypothetical protein
MLAVDAAIRFTLADAMLATLHMPLMLAVAGYAMTALTCHYAADVTC